MKNHNYYKEDRIRKWGTWDCKLIYIFEHDFSYRLAAKEVTNEKSDAENKFNEWLERQLIKAPERLVFEKLLVSIEVLCEEKANLCSRLWNLNTYKSHSEGSYSHDCEKITGLVYEHTLIIEKAMTYIVLFLQQLKGIDVMMMLNSTDFENDPLPYYRSLEVIEQILPTVELLNRS